MSRTPNPIRVRRAELGITAEELVRRTGGHVSQKMLSRLENGHVDALKISKSKFAALALGLGLTETELESLFASSGGTEVGSAAPAKPVVPDEHRARHAELERSVEIGISKMRDELRRMDDHLSALEEALERLRAR